MAENILLPSYTGVTQYDYSFGVYALSPGFADVETYVRWHGLFDLAPIEGNIFVEFDGVTYECAQQRLAALDNAMAIGNCAPFGGTGNNEPFVCTILSVDTGDGNYVYPWAIGVLGDTAPTEHTVEVYQVEASTAFAVVLKDRSGANVTYEVPSEQIKLNTPNGTQIFTAGQAVDNVSVTLDLADGDQTVTAGDGQLIKSAIIQKPATLSPANIVKDVNIAGVVGTFEGGGGGNKEAEIIEGTISGSYTNATCQNIRTYAFKGCLSLTAVDFPACTSIGSFAFESCTGLTSVNFPKCITISYYAFQSCTGLTTVSFPTCPSIGMAAFKSCKGLTTVSFPACTSIGPSAFESCTGLTTADFPECTTIGGTAFAYCSRLANISFPKCTTIGGGAFQYSAIFSTVNFPECIIIDANAFKSCSLLESISFPKCTSLGAYAFSSCARLTAADFPACTYVGSGAFSNCTHLKTANFPECTTIGSYAFASCSQLTSISSPKCSIIGVGAFRACASLTTVKFPVCTSISSSAFYYCSRLATAIFPVCNYIGSSAFTMCGSLYSLYLLGTSIPTLVNISVFYDTPMSRQINYQFGSIFVRESLVSGFKAANIWKVYSNRIVGLTDEEIAAILEG